MATSQPLIFVAIAAYCDPILPQTLDDCLAKARHPERLRFGICWQFDVNRPVNLDRFLTDRRFRFDTHDHRDSKGGCWARHNAQELWDGEVYTLQIDSHMVFAQNWDAALTRMMRAMPADKPLITMIAPLFRTDDQGNIVRETKRGIRATKVTSWTESYGWAPWFDWGQPVRGRRNRNRFLSGQFVFTLGQWTDEVRQDPEHYYWGEEFALALRSFTHGYDFFLPDEIVVWHMEHIGAPPRRHWEHGREVITRHNRTAFERLRKLAYSDNTRDGEALGRFGLGGVRDLAAYERFAGIDLTNKRAHPDLFSGIPPDPVTIKSQADWAHCLTIDEYRQRYERNVA